MSHAASLAAAASATVFRAMARPVAFLMFVPAGASFALLLVFSMVVVVTALANMVGAMFLFALTLAAVMVRMVMSLTMTAGTLPRSVGIGVLGFVISIVGCHGVSFP